MKIQPLAFDSFGVRSMATYVETKDVKILLDPGVALAPRRFGLPPHPVEFERLRQLAKLISNYAEKAQVLTVTHYHYDHHDLGDSIPLKVWEGKDAYVKHPTENINPSQKFERAPLFLKRIEGLPRNLVYADGGEASYGRTVIKFSEAMPHGADPKLGYIFQVSIDDGKEKLVYTSDVEGPVLKEQTAFILAEKPSFLIVDGPMTYMLGYRYTMENLGAAFQNLKQVMAETPVETIILDHHFMRDLNYQLIAAPLYKAAKSRNVKLISAAEYLNRPVEILEACRPELYKTGNLKPSGRSRRSKASRK
ncbi:hypothetical protein DRO53_03915 [Candidatus Bathyarchaeota archaeon]|nr:MAG: hypothetical protein DRO53_03915 [Candidatus Bathyarchaeota archaeon]